MLRRTGDYSHHVVASLFGDGHRLVEGWDAIPVDHFLLVQLVYVSVLVLWLVFAGHALQLTADALAHTCNSDGVIQLSFVEQYFVRPDVWWRRSVRASSLDGQASLQSLQSSAPSSRYFGVF